MRIILTLFITLLAGCSTKPLHQLPIVSVESTTDSAAPNQKTNVTTFYDYQIATPSGDIFPLTDLPDNLINADIILIGEWHTHSAIHRFQTDILKQFITHNIPTTLSMEQFSRDAQITVDQYLTGEIGEQPFMKQAHAWPNYESDYRPLIEYAKANQLDVIAANAPKPVVQCIGRMGLGYLETLAPQERRYIAKTVDNSASQYKNKFMASLHHGTPDQTEKQFSAQMSWDETMAESMVDYLKLNPENKIIHIAGKFHTEGSLGTAASIKKRNPKLKVIVITPVTELRSDSLDYQLLVLDPPARFIQSENRMKAYQALSQRNSTLDCN